LHVDVWTELMSNIYVVLFTIGFSQDLVARNAYFRLEFGLENACGTIS
jgi:hypothetical protein